MIIFCILFWLQDYTIGKINGLNSLVVFHKFLLKELIFVFTSSVISAFVIIRYHYLPE